MRVGGRWMGMLCAIVILLSGCSSTDEGTTTAVTRSTVHIVEPSGTSAPTITSRPETSVETVPTLEVTTTNQTTSFADTPTTDETPAGLITRPYVDPAICGSGAKSEFSTKDLTAYPFALDRDDGTAVQVFGQPTEGVANPFAVTLRLPATARDKPQDHLVTVNGNDIGISVFANGNASAAWSLPDGTKAYLRARDLNESALIALVARLTPRDSSAPIPGFDIRPSSDADAPTLIAEHLNTGLIGTLARFECNPGFNQGIYRIAAIGGDPVFVYLGIMDRPRPYAVGVNGDGAITVTNSFNEAITLQDIANADPDTWASLPNIEQP